MKTPSLSGTSISLILIGFFSVSGWTGCSKHPAEVPKAEELKDAVDLRVYGKVSADLSPARAVFTTESVEKADILLDKLLADLFWDRTLPVRKDDIKVRHAVVTAYTIAGGYGSAIIARSGNKVIVLGGGDKAAVAKTAAQEPLLQGGDVTSRAAKPHPVSLDYFDNRAFKAYIPPMRSPEKFGLESHWPFLKSIGAGAAFFGPMLHTMSPAPGVVDWASQDYEVQEAERQHDLVVVGPNGGGEVPLWVANQSPQNMMKPSDTTLLGDWGGGGMAGAHYESWSAPLADRSAGGLGFFRQAMERYRSSPAVGGWMVFAGSPGVEYNFHGRSTHAWDTSPAGTAGWRDWLRDEKHLSLADLGTRWYGDPKHFPSWDEVDVPDLNEFFGSPGGDSFRLDSGWRWQNAAALAPGPLPADSSGWVPVEMPPSQQLAFVNRKGFNYYDLTFDPSDWLAENGKDAWLAFGMIGTGSDHVRAWLNDQPLALPTDRESRNGSFAVRVAGMLKPGPNHLQVALTPSYQTTAGKPAGPVFLTPREPKRFPYLGTGPNARYADFTEWQGWAMSEFHRKMIALARKLDPDRPMVLSGGADPLFEHAIQLARDYGMGIENTGREASYRPHLPGRGLAAGFYSTSEWSGTPTGIYLDRGFGWILFDADSSHCLYHDIEAFQKREKEEGWFSRHKRQIELFGKYLREQPKIALMESAESSRFQSSGAWDIGRGEIQAAHYDNVYVTEKGVRDGLADRYPVLIDTGSEFIEPETAAAIRKYVEQGGTFVAFHNTAKHTASAPDSHPLAELSGFKVSDNGKGGKIRFAAELPIFKGWENKEFQGWGMAVDWLGEDHARDASAALSSSSDSSVPLAFWPDGSVAVGYRKVGKGRIITLGSTFWRDGKDVSGVWRTSKELEAQFLDHLFTDCGVTRTASASLPEIWTRRMVTKNGLQNWLMALNSTGEARVADVWMQTDGKPDEVIDLVTNTAVPFEFENGGVKIRNVQFPPYEVKTFAVRRGTLVDGLPVWWGEKTTYWKRTPAEIAAAAEALPEPASRASGGVLPLEKWRFRTDPDKAVSAGAEWKAPEFDDSAWSEKRAGAWNLFDPGLKDYHGTGLYRIKFDVPPSWTGQRVFLNLYNFDTPVVYDFGEFFLNGRSVATYKARGWSQTMNYDVTSVVHPGENILALRVDGGQKYGGLGGVVWIEARPHLQPAIDLAGPWEAVRADWLTREPATVPGTATAKFLTRTVDIPADWAGKTTWLEWKTREQWVGAVVINGHPITNNAAVHPFGTQARINVTPYLKPGTSSVIEIWPFRTVPFNDGTDSEETKGLQLDSVVIGCQ